MFGLFSFRHPRKSPVARSRQRGNSLTLLLTSATLMSLSLAITSVALETGATQDGSQTQQLDLGLENRADDCIRTLQQYMEQHKTDFLEEYKADYTVTSNLTGQLPHRGLYYTEFEDLVIPGYLNQGDGPGMTKVKTEVIKVNGVDKSVSTIISAGSNDAHSAPSIARFDGGMGNRFLLTCKVSVGQGTPFIKSTPSALESVATCPADAEARLVETPLSTAMSNIGTSFSISRPLENTISFGPKGFCTLPLRDTTKDCYFTTATNVTITPVYETTLSTSQQLVVFKSVVAGAVETIKMFKRPLLTTSSSEATSLFTNMNAKYIPNSKPYYTIASDTNENGLHENKLVGIYVNNSGQLNQDYITFPTVFGGTIYTRRLFDTSAFIGSAFGATDNHTMSADGKRVFTSKNAAKKIYFADKDSEDGTFTETPTSSDVPLGLSSTSSVPYAVGKLLSTLDGKVVVGAVNFGGAPMIVAYNTDNLKRINIENNVNPTPSHNTAPAGYSNVAILANYSAANPPYISASSYSNLNIWYEPSVNKFYWTLNNDPNSPYVYEWDPTTWGKGPHPVLGSGKFVLGGASDNSAFTGATFQTVRVLKNPGALPGFTGFSSQVVFNKVNQEYYIRDGGPTARIWRVSLAKGIEAVPNVPAGTAFTPPGQTMLFDETKGWLFFTVNMSGGTRVFAWDPSDPDHIRDLFDTSVAHMFYDGGAQKIYTPLLQSPNYRFYSISLPCSDLSATGSTSIPGFNNFTDSISRDGVD